MDWVNANTKCSYFFFLLLAVSKYVMTSEWLFMQTIIILQFLINVFLLFFYKVQDQPWSKIVKFSHEVLFHIMGR